MCRILVDISFERELCAARQGGHWWVMLKQISDMNVVRMCICSGFSPLEGFGNSGPK